MFRSSLKSEAGYSLVEVMVSIVILSIAIIPMVAMFDMALTSSSTSGNYDKARALANKQLETAKSRPYGDVRDDFPNGTEFPEGGSEVTSASQTDADFPRFSYTVAKQFVTLEGNNIVGADEDLDMMRITVEVTRPGSDVPYSASGIVTVGGRPSGDGVPPEDPGDGGGDPPEEPPQCSDGENNDPDEDSFIDADDPGCDPSDPADDTESPNPPGLSIISDVSDTEGNSGTKNFNFTVRRSGSATGTSTVQYVTFNGTATTANSDYEATNGTLTFAPTETEKTVTVTVRGDTTPESDETFFLNLSDAVGAEIVDGEGVGTIRNDDAPLPVFSINDRSDTEGNSGTKNFNFTVTRTGDLSRAASVNYATANGSASSSSDYNERSGTLNFAINEATKTVAVQVRGDTTVEPDETFEVRLSSPTNATIGDGTGVGTIRNDDAAPANRPPVAVNDGTFEVEEDDTLNLRDSRNLLRNDNDPDGDSITVTSYTQPVDSSGRRRGTVTINASGSGTYESPDNFEGRVTFTYTISDGRGGTATATVTIRVEDD